MSGSAETLKLFDDMTNEQIINWMLENLTEEQIKECLTGATMPDIPPEFEDIFSKAPAETTTVKEEIIITVKDKTGDESNKSEVFIGEVDKRLSDYRSKAYTSAYLDTVPDAAIRNAIINELENELSLAT